MAVVAGRWFYEIVLVDTGNQSARRKYEINNPADYAAALAAAAALRTDILGISSMSFKSDRVWQEYYDDALSLPASAQKENQACFVFQLPDPSKTAKLYVPAPEAGIMVALSGVNSNVVDTTDAAVIAFADNFLSGGSNLFLISDGEEPDTLLRGHRMHTSNSFG